MGGEGRSPKGKMGKESMGSGQGLADRQGVLCRETPRALEGEGAGGQRVGLQGLAAGQDTSLLILMGASAFPGLPLPTPHWEPSPRLRPPSPGPLGGVARGSEQLSERVCRVRTSRLKGRGARRPRLTSGNAGFVNSRAGSRRPRDLRRTRAITRTSQNQERRSSRLLRGDNPASSPRSLLKRIPLTRHLPNE